MKARHLLFGIHINDRVHRVPDVQQLFSDYGCFITTRIGLHHVDENACSPRGLILLEMFGDEIKCQELSAKLSAIDGVEVQQMTFDHEP